MAEPHRTRRVPRALAALLLGVVAVDVVLSAWIGSKGLLLGHPLPPYGAITHPRQCIWVDELRIAPRGTGVFDAELGWTVRASATSLDGKARTNSIGARGTREYVLAKPAGITRVVCVGDSYTWGDEVGDADTFEAQLEALRPDVECINLGVAAYGTDQALLRWRRDGERLAPDVLVVGFLVENMGRNVNRYRPLWYPSSGAAPAKPRFVLAKDGLELVPQPFATGVELADAIEDGSVTSRLAEHEHWRSSSSWWGVSALARCVAAVVSDHKRDVARLLRDEEDEPFRVTLELLRAFRAKRVLVVVFPREVDLEHLGAGERRPWSGLVDELQRSGIEHLDVSDELARLRAESGADHQRLHPYVGGHLSRAGNAAVARELEKRLR